MLTLPGLLSNLKYDGSAFYRTQIKQFEPETAHLFRATFEIKTSTDGGAEVNGVYVFQTSHGSNAGILPNCPAVYVAKATNQENARQVHKSLWNLGYAPFILILLPDHIRVYTGFDYAPPLDDQAGLLNIDFEDEKGLLDRQSLDSSHLMDILSEFSADSIDIGHIWQSRKYGGRLDPDRRVDKRLLKNLRELGKALKVHESLAPEIAHALIGKYVYIRYLRDRGILTDEWLKQNGIDQQYVFHRKANVQELSKLASKLEDRFNGRIFPLKFDTQNGLNDDHVALAASVFMGDSLDASASPVVQQLYLDFQAYNFRYIPVELLSAVYEQFIEDAKKKGAIYTPEAVADYLLSEVHSLKPLTPQTKVIDPACGSGIFLVLTYRRLIEHELARRSIDQLSPDDLKDLLKNLYGVEREKDACFVTEFSLILTLLHYIEPRELHKQDEEFKFPCLHNKQVFQGDFFNDELEIWKASQKFDWVVGNPPWVKADEKQPHAREWIEKNKAKKPVADLSVAEAFSWRVTDILKDDGVVGLLIPATRLVNLNSKEYRQSFFEKHRVIRITNFANMRGVLFDNRSALPPASIIYKKRAKNEELTGILHYGPFIVNQVPSSQGRPWVITINENEVQNISYTEAIIGETSTWKFALWGSNQDERAIDRIRHLIPTTLEEFCFRKGWGKKLPQQGAELRDGTEQSEDELEHLEELVKAKVFSTNLFNMEPRRRFTIPKEALIDNDKHFIRKRGGKAGLRVNSAPHIIISKGWRDFIIYSDESFVIPPQQMGIAAPKKDAKLLRALSVYLNSSLVKYYLFFQVPEWGIFRDRESVTVSEVRKIPTPDFTQSQINELADLEQVIAIKEKLELATFTNSLDALHNKIQADIDNAVYKLFRIPDDIATLANEFVYIKLSLDKGKALIQSITKEPTRKDLAAYASVLGQELDGFAMDEFYHTITITKSPEFIECVIEFAQKKPENFLSTYSVKEADLSTAELLAEIRNSAGEQFSQWVYIQRGLRLFEGRRIYMYKPPRLINWTRTQAYNDADDIIGQAMYSGYNHIS